LLIPQKLVGKKIGNYVIQKPIGAGGMGAVFLAEHPEIGRKVAVKLLPPDLTLRPGFIERFRAEARAVTRIDHPNVIDIFDYGQTEDGQLYYIMELLRGCELASIVKKQAPMSAEAAWPYVEQICDALQAAHDADVVHRDLKPENIFVLERKQLSIKLLDFGLAKITAADDAACQTATGVVMGTPLTIAPEQAAGQVSQIGPHTDLYSLGVILYWMLAGAPPFTNKVTAMLLARHISEPAPPLAAQISGVPAPIAELVDQCLLKPPADRPQSAAEIAQRFGEHIAAPAGSLRNNARAKPAESAAAEGSAAHAVAPIATAEAPISGFNTTMAGEVSNAHAPSDPVVERPASKRLALIAALAVLVLGAGAALMLTGNDRNRENGETNTTPIAPGNPMATAATGATASRPDAAMRDQKVARAGVDAGARDSQSRGKTTPADLGTDAQKRAPKTRTQPVRRRIGRRGHNKPAVRTPTAKKPAAKKPATKKPATKKPAAKDPKKTPATKPDTAKKPDATKKPKLGPSSADW
jgi:serine/threonine protein kinase